MVPRLQNDQIRISRKILRQFIGLTFILSQSYKFSFLRHLRVFLSYTYFNSDTPAATYYTRVTANYRRPNVQLYIHASDG